MGAGTAAWAAGRGKERPAEGKEKLGEQRKRDSEKERPGEKETADVEDQRERGRRGREKKGD